MTTDAKPLYRRWWFIALAVLVVLGIIGSLSDSGEEGNETTTAAEETQQKPSTTADKKEDDLDETLRVMDSISAASMTGPGTGISRSDIAQAFKRLSPGFAYETWTPVGEQPNLRGKVPENMTTGITTIGPDEDLYVVNFGSDEVDPANRERGRKLLLAFAKLVDPDAPAWVEKALSKSNGELQLVERAFGERYAVLRYADWSLSLDVDRTDRHELTN